MTPESPLERISIASPCSADWNEMAGDDQIRFCQLCQLNVYNLSGMTRQDAENLLLSREGRLCVRYFKREDGTVLTKDCPVGLQIKYRRRLKRFGSLAAAVTLVTAVGVFVTQASAETGKTVKMGEVPVQTQPVVKMGKPMMPPLQGDVAVPQPPKPPKQPPKPPKQPPKQGQDCCSPPPPQHEMGRIKID